MIVLSRPVRVCEPSFCCGANAERSDWRLYGPETWDLHSIHCRNHLRMVPSPAFRRCAREYAHRFVRLCSPIGLPHPKPEVGQDLFACASASWRTSELTFRPASPEQNHSRVH
jgi:hypothetical protein